MLGKMWHGPVFAAAAAVAAVVLAGCGGGGDSSHGTGADESSPHAAENTADSAIPTAGSAVRNAAGELQPCAILTRAEAQAAIGEPVSAGTKGETGCEFKASGKGSEEVIVGAYGAVTGTRFHDLSTGAGVLTGVSPVAGLGDQAAIDSTDTYLTVRLGSNAFIVQMLLNDRSKAELKTASIAIAKSILARVA